MRARVLVGTDGQRAVDAWLAETASARRAIIVEGVFLGIEAPADVPVTSLASGCVCCLGQLPLRVSLVRLVRSLRPEAILLVLSGGEHAARVRALLADGSLGVRFDVE
jgi:G3E family GTPase